MLEIEPFEKARPFSGELGIYPPKRSIRGVASRRFEERPMLKYKAGYKFVDGGVHAPVVDFPAAITCAADLTEARRLLTAALLDVAETRLAEVKRDGMDGIHYAHQKRFPSLVCHRRQRGQLSKRVGLGEKALGILFEG